jgi:cell division septum initiation protein DivIVA
MSHLRRRRGSGPEDENGAQNDPKSSTQRFIPYSLGEGLPRPEPEPKAEPPAPSPNDSAAYERLGEHVSTVLSSADEAAKRLKASATTDAKRIRGEAEDYAKKTRAAADSYAEQRREGAETQASAITADAERRAGEVRNAAKEKASEIQRDAIQRREALLGEAERSEERLQNLLKVFRAMTEQLEKLVSATDRPLSEKTEASIDAELTEAVAESRGSAPSPGAPRAQG